MRKNIFDKMIEFGDAVYYLDIEAFEKAIASKDTEEIQTKETTVTQLDGSKLVTTELITAPKQSYDIPKYQLIDNLIEVLLDDMGDEEEDTKLGSDRILDKKSFAMKLAFNTLILTGVLKEQE